MHLIKPVFCISDIRMYKNQLQELAQRSCFNLPSYSCVREGPDHSPRFKATVNFNGETFESPAFCSTLRLAEHAAAEVALNTLANRGPSKTLAAKVLDDTGTYKNLLQETAHRAGLELPVYTTVRSGSGHVPVFSCTVELAGMSFSGEPAKTKKQAQKNAAMVAWTSLKQLARNRSPTSTSTSSTSAQVSSDEQDQVIIARFLSSLPLPESSKSSQINHQRSISSDRVQNLGPPLYTSPHESWAYSSFPPEVAMYQIWQQQAYLLQLQTRLFPLPISLNAPNPQVVPRVHSIFQEPVTIAPMSPSSYMPRGFISSPIQPIQGNSVVKIQEIEEKTVVHDQAQDKQTIRPQSPLMMSPHRIGSQKLGNRMPAPSRMKSGASAYSNGPMMEFGRVSPRFMAPAVQIRSVSPVCSAPPVAPRNLQNTSQIGQSSNHQVKSSGQDSSEASEPNFGVEKV